MTILGAARHGFRRSLGSPLVLLAVWGVPFLLALPAAWVLSESLRDSIGSSLVHENLRQGIDAVWLGEYRTGAKALEETFDFTVNGAGAFLSNLEDWLDGGLAGQFPGLLALAGVSVMIWALLLGGVLERFVRPEAPRGAGPFIQAGGRYYFRFLRLAILSAPLYFVVYKLHGRVFERLEEMTRDITNETTVFLYSLLGYALTAWLLILVRTCFSYAKIATVAEGRRSVLAAAVRGVVFVVTHPLKTLGLYYGMILLGAILLLTYAWIAPDGTESSLVGILLAALMGQAYLLLRTYLRLSLIGGETGLFLAWRGKLSEPPAG